jgi:hypothetical protein
MTPTNQPSDHIASLANFLLQYAYTEAQIVGYSAMLKRYLEEYYFTEMQEKKFEAIMEKVQQLENVTEIHRKLLMEFNTTYVSLFTQETMYTLLDAVKKHLFSLPRIVLHTPVSLDTESISRIGAWLRSNISPTIIVSTRINPLLVAGLGIGWNTRYTEFSFDEKMRSKKEQLYSLLPTYEPTSH